MPARRRATLPVPAVVASEPTWAETVAKLSETQVCELKRLAIHESAHAIKQHERHFGSKMFRVLDDHISRGTLSIVSAIP